MKQLCHEFRSLDRDVVEMVFESQNFDLKLTRTALQRMQPNVDKKQKAAAKSTADNMGKARAEAEAQARRAMAAAQAGPQGEKNFFKDVKPARIVRLAPLQLYSSSASAAQPVIKARESEQGSPTAFY